MKHIKLAFAGLVVGSLALSAHATTNTWWSYNFSENRYSDPVAWTNANTYADRWERNGQDQSSIQASWSNRTDVIVLNTEGEDLTYTPTNVVEAGYATDTVLIDTEVFFVGSETELTLDDSSIQFALCLKTPEDGATNLMAYVFDDDAGQGVWTDLDLGIDIEDKSWHHVVVSLNYSLNDKGIVVEVDGHQSQQKFKFACGNSAADHLESVSFRGTGGVDNFVGNYYAEDAINYTEHTFKGLAYVDGVEWTDSCVEYTNTVAGSQTFSFPSYAGEEGSAIDISKIVLINFEGNETEVTAEYDYQAEIYVFTPSIEVISDNGATVDINISFAGAAETGDSQEYTVVKVYYGSTQPPAQNYTVTFTTAHSTAPAAQTVASGELATEPTALEAEGYVTQTSGNVTAILDTTLTAELIEGVPVNIDPDLGAQIDITA